MSLPLGENGVRSPLPPPARGLPAPPGRGRVTKAKPNSRHFACGLLRARRPLSPQCPFYKQAHGWARPRERSEGSLKLRPRLLLPPPPPPRLPPHVRHAARPYLSLADLNPRGRYGRGCSLGFCLLLREMAAGVLACTAQPVASQLLLPLHTFVPPGVPGQ
ncbi:uncharacterized protein LOC121063776 isoform X6 [Cygnus olor]|uniref:uncharacterized protein LOC121063776 isoform X6 n=1 Tax=Cygnus olor TaxID=8869 RepID=UPI001ADE8F0B|nr:uncharacterized protein LOC121063776 isoform X6 [Cygnus olor]